jgi:hypothetical protein
MRWGYGQLSHRNKRVLAHRVAFGIAQGVISPGLDVCHRCDNPPCCNPAHLFFGTRSDNMTDCANKGRNGAHSRPDRLPRGDRHGRYTRPERTARGEQVGTSKLSESQVREIRRERAAGASLRVIAERYRVSKRCVHLIVKRRNWAWLDPEEAK